MVLEQRYPRVATHGVTGLTIVLWLGSLFFANHATALSVAENALGLTENSALIPVNALDVRNPLHPARELPTRSYILATISTYLPFQQRITLARRSERRPSYVAALPESEPPTRAGRLSIHVTSPSDAVVYVNDRLIGRGTVNASLSPGTYRIKIEKTGYESYIDNRVEILAAKLTSREVTLARDPNAGTAPTRSEIANTVSATLRVSSAPASASVFIAGRLVGTTAAVPIERSVPPGTYEIRVVLRDFKEWRETRTVEAGQTETVNAELVALPRDESQPSRRRGFDLAVAIIGGISVAIAALVAAIVFALKRRSPSRPAQAEYRNVTPWRLEQEAFGKYDVLGELGRGGMGVVYKARNRESGGIVALKIPFENLAQNAQFLDRFHRQAEIGHMLSHPRIVSVLEDGSVSGVPYLAMEFVEGADLRRRLNERGGVTIVQAVRYAMEVCEALDYVHLKDIYHRDIKPENILLTVDDTVKVMDFGIALAKQLPSLSVDGVRWFSPGYRCPDREIGRASDLYSLGIVLYEMLAGRLPFVSDDIASLLRMHEVDIPTPVSGLRPDVPGALSAVVDKMLAKEPANRYREAVHVIQALRPFLALGR